MKGKTAVRALVRIAGKDHGVYIKKGQTVELPTPLADRLIREKKAERVEEDNASKSHIGAKVVRERRVPRRR